MNILEHLEKYIFTIIHKRKLQVTSLNIMNSIFDYIYIKNESRRDKYCILDILVDINEINDVKIKQEGERDRCYIEHMIYLNNCRLWTNTIQGYHWQSWDTKHDDLYFILL